MIKPTLDELLVRSAPPREPDAELRIAEVVRASHPAPTGRRARSRALWAIPAIGLGALTLTAGAYVTSLIPDATIPVNYVTDTGVEIQCTVYLEAGSLFDGGAVAMQAYLRDQEWNGIGQQIYDRALEYSEVSHPEDAVFNSPAERDLWLWQRAENELTVLALPSALWAGGEVHLAGDSDCTGQLH